MPQSIDLAGRVRTQRSPLLARAMTGAEQGQSPTVVARFVCEAILGNAAPSPELLLSVADELIDCDLPAIAAEVFHRILALDPGNVQALFGLARTSYSQGELESAIGFCEDVIAGDADMNCLLDASPDSVGPLMQWIIDGPPLKISKTQLDCLVMFGELRAVLNPTRQGRMVRALLPELLNVSAMPHPVQSRILAAILAMGFSRRAPREWTAYLLDDLLVPLMRSSVADGAYELALQLEGLIYAEHVKTTETESHFRNCYQLIAPIMDSAGRQYSQGLPPLPPDNSREFTIGFILHNSGLLAHAEVLLDYLIEYSSLADRPFTPIVYMLFNSRRDTALVERLSLAGIAINWMEDEVPAGNMDTLVRLTALRKHACKVNLDAAVWISVVPCMAFSFAMRIAPTQIWWAMKYHSLNLQSIDEYLTGWSIGRTKKIGARIWRSGRLGLPNWYDPSLSSEAELVRMQYGRGRIIIGSFGREEKLDSREFLQSICRILRANSTALFLWTGRSRLPSIEALFREQNVAGQTCYIGWVNTKMYAQVIDIFADSFPFPCGFTAVQAMAAGKPIVLYESAEAIETGIHGIVAPILAGIDGTMLDQSRVREIFSPPLQESMYYCARTGDQYVAHLQKLIDDVPLRDKAGDACRQFVEEFFSDRSKMCRSFTGHFIDMLKSGNSHAPEICIEPGQSASHYRGSSAEIE